MSALENAQNQLESIPGYSLAMDKFNSYAEDHWNNRDPFTDPKTGKKLKLPPDITTKQEQKAWSKIQSKAWQHDKCMCGSCGVGLDCGLGLVPFAVLFFPVLGPLVMYAMHARLIEIAKREFHLPNKLEAQLNSNIGIDLLITFPPVIGSFFGWLHGCSTRNAGMIYAFMLKHAQERAAAGGGGAKYTGRGTAGTFDAGAGEFGGQPETTQVRGGGGVGSSNVRSAQYSNPTQPKSAYTKKSGIFSKNTSNSIEIGQQQQAGFR
ncbi:uncharacterized protein LODBEIA_P45170 [Lodderomyces beijingensis]|uniref:Uncharacterized protein n=1 Tax=Lodderomyces beijingensis TaxID=1775926 RepID=A0ABP0ZRI2_9ASCO